MTIPNRIQLKRRIDNNKLTDIESILFKIKRNEQKRFEILVGKTKPTCSES